jgi:NAD(P)-dependent dehydrogenase (short-subunit alcohol dehydrogenase family)
MTITEFKGQVALVTGASRGIAHCTELPNKA